MEATQSKAGSSKAVDMDNNGVLEYIYSLLVQKYQDNDNKPLNYFAFILNPFSFKITCENILHMSNLVNQSLVRMYRHDGEVVMEPIQPDQDEIGGLQTDKAKQTFAIKLDCADWKEMICVYEVVEPMIKITAEKNN